MGDVGHAWFMWSARTGCTVSRRYFALIRRLWRSPAYQRQHPEIVPVVAALDWEQD